MLTHEKFTEAHLEADKILTDLSTQVFRVAMLDKDGEFYLLSYLDGKVVKLSVTDSKFRNLELKDLSAEALHKYSMFNVNLAEWVIGNKNEFPLVENITLINKFKSTLGIPEENTEYKNYKI